MVSDNIIDTVTDMIDQERDFLVEFTRELVRIPTVNPKFEQNEELNKEAELQNYLEPILQEIDFATELDTPSDLPGRPNLTGQWEGNSEKSLTLCGHVDVVPAGDLSLWSVDPFAAELKNDRIYGRGALDMKAGLACYIMACRAIRKAGVELDGALSVHAVVDEEAGGFGCMDLLTKTSPGKAVLVGEPTYGNIFPSEGGLEWVRVTIRGKNAHAGWRFNSIYPQPYGGIKPEPGVNALEFGVLFLNSLRELEREWGIRKRHPNMPPGLTTINPGVMIAGSGMGEDGKPMITNNPAIVPDTCIMEFDLKFLPNEMKELVREEFENFVHHFSQQYHWLRENPPLVTWELGGLHFPPVDTAVDHPLVASLRNRIKAQGKEPHIAGFEAVTDAAHYAGHGADTVIYGPSGDGFHGIDEYVEIPSMLEVSKVVAGTILDWCGCRDGT